MFVVKNEFSIKLTLFNDNFKNPWRLIAINFLTKDEQDSSMSEKNYLMQIKSIKYFFSNSRSPGHTHSTKAICAGYNSATT